MTLRVVKVFKFYFILNFLLKNKLKLNNFYKIKKDICHILVYHCIDQNIFKYFWRRAEYSTLNIN